MISKKNIIKRAGMVIVAACTMAGSLCYSPNQINISKISKGSSEGAP